MFTFILTCASIEVNVEQCLKQKQFNRKYINNSLYLYQLGIVYVQQRVFFMEGVK